MFDYLLTQEQIKLRDEARDFVKWVPRQMVLDMDADVIKFPREFLREAGQRNLFGCRYPKEWGAGHGLGDDGGNAGRDRHARLRVCLRLWRRGGTGLRRDHAAWNRCAKGQVCEAAPQRRYFCC